MPTGDTIAHRAQLTNAPLCFPEANPFAKKVEMGPPKVGIGIGSKKPAAIGLQKSLHKSETFFEKVEAAESSTGPPKREPEHSAEFFSRHQ